MASQGWAGLLPIPCCSGQLDTVAHLLPTHWLVVAERSSPSQSAGTGAVGSSFPSVDAVDSSTPHSASLPRCTLRRQPSTVRAVCVNALVRICAGATSDGRPYRDSYPETLVLYRKRTGATASVSLDLRSSLSIQPFEGGRFVRGGRYGISIDFSSEVVEKKSICGASFKSKFIDLTMKPRLTIASS